MERFHAVGQGWESLAEDGEREVLLHLLGEVNAVLAEEADASVPGGAEVAMLREVLLPEASEDPLVAIDLSAMTRPVVQQRKRERLLRVYTELAAPSGQGGAVRVAWGAEEDWLGALTDLRLTLGWRLGITSAEEADRVVQQAQEDPVALAYEVLGWWQESLLAAVMASAADA